MDIAACSDGFDEQITRYDTLVTFSVMCSSKMSDTNQACFYLTQKRAWNSQENTIAKMLYVNCRNKILESLTTYND